MSDNDTLRAKRAWRKKKSAEPKAFSKRPATEVEEDAMLKYADALYPEYNLKVKLAEAKAEGCISEICSCSRAFLANTHYIRCKNDPCPFKSKSDRRTLLDMLCGPESSDKTAE